MRIRAAAVGILAVAGALGLAAWSLTQPYSGFEGQVFADIPKGTTTPQMARLLAGRGVIRYQWQFLAARALRPRTTLQAGEYLFVAPASAMTVFDRIARGDVHYYEITLPEGSNLFDVARAVGGLGFISPQEFLETASDASAIRDLAPEAKTLEGYLFPSTYRVTRHATAAQISQQMVDHFRQIWRQLDTETKVHAAVTLASLVEKETAVPSERPLVASVFQNRLDRSMKLDCDPTAIYAALLENRYRGTLYRSDLDSKHRYNTYRHAGLPPGPIASPGLASLKAAIQPARTPYLYFVAKPGGDGSHVFSTTLADHERAVAKYKRGNRKANQEKRTGRASGGKKAKRG